jgi:topoisomerase-4 subunit A
LYLKKWTPKKPISAIYYDGTKERYFVKRFLIENEGKEESFITDHPDTQLEIVSTDWRPVAEVEFKKERGKDRRPNLTVDIEDFISIKGITAQGNQLTKEKVNQISLMDPLPFDPPKEIPANDMDVIDATDAEDESVVTKNKEDNRSGNSQATLF